MHHLKPLKSTGYTKPEVSKNEMIPCIKIVEYVWIDAAGNLRSKARTLDKMRIGVSDIDNIPQWSFDGSSTKQAESSKDSEIILKPVALFKDPFRNTPNLIPAQMVLCECYDRYGFPLDSNTRYPANEIFDKVLLAETWYGLEQEYVLYDIKTGDVLGWPATDWEYPDPPDYLSPHDEYYCGVGAGRVFGREIVEEHYMKCLEAGIKISGINGEVMPGQWEFQVGPCEGISVADHLWMARYILHRVCEKHNVIASFDPKPKPHMNGSGMHLNFSTMLMREGNGIEYIYLAIAKLEKSHDELIKSCGDNTKRLTGTHETSKLDCFTFGVADRTASVRIPSHVSDDRCGYLEYRVPASDADPYVISSMVAKTILLD